MNTNWKLEMFCIIMFTGIYLIIYPISLHLPMTYTFTKLVKHHTCHVTSLTVKSSNSFLCKGPLIWNRIPFTIQQKHNITGFAVSLKAIVVKGYEELAEAYSI